jgi:hypothetical protein
MLTIAPQPAENRSLTEEELVQVNGGVDVGAIAAELYVLTFCVGSLPWGTGGSKGASWYKTML